MSGFPYFPHFTWGRWSHPIILTPPTTKEVVEGRAIPISAMTSPRLCEVSGQLGLGLAVNKSIIVSFQEEDQILYKSSPIPRSLTPVDSFPLVRAVGHGKRFQAIDGN